MRDCNTCRYHVQGGHPPLTCQACLSLRDLPLWEPKETPEVETLETSDLSPHAVAINYQCTHCGVFAGESHLERCRYLPNTVLHTPAHKSVGEFATKDSGQRVAFDSGMVRDVDTDKVKWHLVASGPMLQRWAELLTRGAEKYAEDNWMKANGEAEFKRFRASAFRHFMQWFRGDTDEDHAAAVMFNVNGAEYVRAKIA